VRYYWAITKALAAGSIARWGKLMMDDGIMGLNDMGSGTIHTNEPHQAAFFSMQAVDHVTQLNNPLAGALPDFNAQGLGPGSSQKYFKGVHNKLRLLVKLVIKLMNEIGVNHKLSQSFMELAGASELSLGDFVTKVADLNNPSGYNEDFEVTLGLFDIKVIKAAVKAIKPHINQIEPFLKGARFTTSWPGNKLSFHVNDVKLLRSDYFNMPTRRESINDNVELFVRQMNLVDSVITLNRMPNAQDLGFMFPPSFSFSKCIIRATMAEWDKMLGTGGGQMIKDGVPLANLTPLTKAMSERLDMSFLNSKRIAKPNDFQFSDCKFEVI